MPKISVRSRSAACRAPPPPIRGRGAALPQVRRRRSAYDRACGGAFRDSASKSRAARSAPAAFFQEERAARVGLIARRREGRAVARREGRRRAGQLAAPRARAD